MVLTQHKMCSGIMWYFGYQVKVNDERMNQ